MPRRAAIPLLLAALTLAVYAQVARYDFINFDDPGYARDNPHVLAGLSREGLVWAFTTTKEANWHPLTWLSLQLDAQLFGPSPPGFHATNVVLHVANVLLLYLLFQRMTRSSWRSALVAALFGIHPVHVESVAWIAERKDVLSALFGLAACHLWLNVLERPSVARHALAAGTYAASLLAKPMLVSLPILLLLFDVWPLARKSPLKARLLEKAPLFALAALFCLVTLKAQAQGGVIRSFEQYPLDARIANAAVSTLRYLGKAIWPVDLSVFYPYPYGGIPVWQVVGSAAALIVVTTLCLRARASAPCLLTGWLWYLVTLVPIIGIVQVGSQAMADRYTYLPLIGPFAMAAFALPARFRIASIAGAGIAVALLAVTAHRQAAYWRDSRTLFAHAVEVTTENAVAESNLGGALLELGEIDAGIEHCREAIRIAPQLGGAQSNLVRGLLARGKTDEAAALVRDGLRDRPDDSRTHVNAGLVAILEGRNEDAVASFQRAIRLDANDQEAHLNLGAAFENMGRRDLARAEYEEAVRLRPRDRRARQALDDLDAQP